MDTCIFCVMQHGCVQGCRRHVPVGWCGIVSCFIHRHLQLVSLSLKIFDGAASFAKVRFQVASLHHMCHIERGLHTKSRDSGVVRWHFWRHCKTCASMLCRVWRCYNRERVLAATTFSATLRSCANSWLKSQLMLCAHLARQSLAFCFKSVHISSQL